MNKTYVNPNSETITLKKNGNKAAPTAKPKQAKKHNPNSPAYENTHYQSLIDNGTALTITMMNGDVLEDVQLKQVSAYSIFLTDGLMVMKHAVSMIGGAQ